MKKPKGTGFFKKTETERRKESRNRSLSAVTRYERREKLLDRMLQMQQRKTEKRGKKSLRLWRRKPSCAQTPRSRNE
jgi:hypothetical protein